MRAPSQAHSQTDAPGLAGAGVDRVDREYVEKDAGVGFAIVTSPTAETSPPPPGEGVRRQSTG